MPNPDKLAGTQRTETDGVAKTVCNRGGICNQKSRLAVDIIGIAGIKKIIGRIHIGNRGCGYGRGSLYSSLHHY